MNGKYTFRIVELYTELGQLKRKTLYTQTSVHSLDYALNMYEQIAFQNPDPNIRILLELDDNTQPANKRKIYRKSFGPNERSIRRMKMVEKIQADARRHYQNEQSAMMPYTEIYKHVCPIPRCHKTKLSERGLHIHLRKKHELTWEEVYQVEKKACAV